MVKVKVYNLEGKEIEEMKQIYSKLVPVYVKTPEEMRADGYVWNEKS